MSSAYERDLRELEKDRRASEEHADEIEVSTKAARRAEADAMNRDPITGAPGSHPVGTGIGTTGGMIAGAAAGSVAGPVGTAVGGVVGAIVGAAAGHGIGEAVNPTTEESYWQTAYIHEPYYNPAYTYDDYAPAYRYGFQTLGKSGAKIWEEQQDAALRREWEFNRGASRLMWDDARHASLAAWNRVNRRRTAY